MSPPGPVGFDLSVIGSVHDVLLRERNRGTAIVVSSHTPLDMEIADTVLFLCGGRVTAGGPPEELLGSLPDVVRIRGSIGRLPDEVTDHLVGRRLYEHGDEARGFLAGDTGFERIERIANEQPGTIHVSNEPPSYVDLFNFQTKLEGPLEASE